MITFGERVTLYKNVGFYLDSSKAKITIGNYIMINERTSIKCLDSVSIGDDCAIFWDVVIMDTDYHTINFRNMTSQHIWEIMF